MAAKSNLTNMVLVLGLTCLFCSAVLGGAYVLTKDPIDAATAEKTNRAIAQVLPSFENASERSFVEVYGKDFPYYEAKNGETLVGYAIESTVVGFGGNLTVMVGVTPDRKVCNTSVLSRPPRPGCQMHYGSQIRVPVGRLRPFREKAHGEKGRRRRGCHHGFHHYLPRLRPGRRECSGGF